PDTARREDAGSGRAKGWLLPFGTVTPLTPFWQDALRRCHEQHHMPGLRLFPAWHGYGLDRPAFASLLKAASERDLVVQLVFRLEDERTLHPLLRVQPLDPAPRLELGAGLPRVRLAL